MIAGKRRLARSACRRSRGRRPGRTPSPTATARFSSTTGDGATCRELRVERRDARPVGLVRCARARMTRGDRRLQRVRAARAAQLLGALERREPAADEQLIPVRPVLIEQQDRLARRVRRARAIATPGSPSAPRGRAPRAPAARARRECGRAAARLRTAPGRIQSSPAVAE